MEEPKKRKHPRLKEYDYSSTGAYFVTICVQDKRCVLSRIVGRGLAPAVEKTAYGKIVEQTLLQVENRFPNLAIDKYVIMPNHIHAILVFKNNAAGASPRPTIMDVVCAFKSTATLECRKSGFSGKLFQTSFYEHIIRGRDDYEAISRYIYENPMRWTYDELYSED